METRLGILFVAATMLASSAVFAQSADDKKWIAQCISDNKDEGAKAEVVKKYCECMVDKMEEKETRSVTQFEKANPASRKDCEKKAGWK